MDDGNPEIVVGATYFGSTIVDVKTTIKETKVQVHTKKVITLENGIIMTEDHYKEKSMKEQEQPFDDATYKDYDDEPIIGFGNLKMIDEKAGYNKSKKKKNNDRRKAPPLEIKVYHSKDPEIPDASPDNPRGVWMVPEDASVITEDSCFWEPQDVLLYKPGEEPEDVDPTLPIGVWCYSKGTEPDDESRTWQPYDAVLYPPGSIVPDNVVPDAMYTYAPRNKSRDWPPPPGKPRRVRPRPGKIQIPRIFNGEEWEPIPATAFPKAKKPDLFNPDNDPFSGVWEHLDEEIDDADWVPMEVIIVRKGSMAIEPDEPHGVFAVTNTAEPNDKGQWEPEDFLFFPPGKEPSDDCKPLGMWKPPPGKLNIKWPPVKEEIKKEPRKVNKLKIPKIFEGEAFDPLPATAFPRSKVPMGRINPDNDDPVSGVWEHLGDDVDDDDWAPMEIIIVGPAAASATKSEPRGIFAVSNFAEPDDDGGWEPEDFVFLPPGKEPDDNCTKVGMWMPPPAKLDVPWPPESETPTRQPRAVGKLPNWQLPGDWASNNARVFPRRTAPSRNFDEISQGVWRYRNPADEPADSHEWEPQDVIMYQDGFEPPDLDEVQPMGVWGTNPGSQPHEEDGQWRPEDVWFYAPSETPESGFDIRGKWAHPPGKLNPTWPPPRLLGSGSKHRPGKVAIPAFDQSPSTRNLKKVGKLQIPTMFAHESPKHLRKSHDD